MICERNMLVVVVLRILPFRCSRLMDLFVCNSDHRSTSVLFFGTVRGSLSLGSTWYSWDRSMSDARVFLCMRRLWFCTFPSLRLCQWGRWFRRIFVVVADDRRRRFRSREPVIAGFVNRHETMAFLTMCLVIFCCCANVVVLELIMKRNSQSGNIVTFVQFVFIALEGFIVTMNFGSKRLIIPLKRSLALVIVSFAVNVSNNWALNFNVSMPLHMIFKSGSLLANMIMNIIVLRRRYSMSKFVSVGMVTVGILTCTMASAKEMSSHGSADYFNWLVGVGLLSFSLIASAYLGIMQERLYQEYPNKSKEVMFVAHAVPLPGFLFLYADLSARVVEYNESPASLGAIPVMWLLLLANTLLQYTCLRSVYKLQTLCSSLTVTLVITLRKFVSLIFSIVYFQNPFTAQHWAGAALVFLGALMFAEVVKIPGSSGRKASKRHSE